jgi:lysophospholipase L1-like esterase
MIEEISHSRIDLAAVIARVGFMFLLLLGAIGAPQAVLAEMIQIVAVGDSNIAGKGVSSSENYPAKLERALRARGYDVHVANAGINALRPIASAQGSLGPFRRERSSP